jgi:transcriptional regulator with XRE-family HTH domain
VRTPILNGLGQALRWLRDRQGKKQYQVADSAGITKGMLSAYETGRQRPSLETLEKILDTLGCDLNDLHNAIQIINGRPEQMKRRGEGSGEDEEEAPRVILGGSGGSGRSEVQRLFGNRDPLPPEEEKALGEMLDGFHKFLRYLHSTIAQALRRRDETPTSNPGQDDDPGSSQ